MIRRPGWHGPTIVGRLRSDAGLLVLTALVVAVTTLVTAAVGPVSDRASDRAMVAVVRDAGLGGAVVATLPRDPYAPIVTVRAPRAPAQLARVEAQAQDALPPRLADTLDPGITTVTTPALHLLDGGPGRSLQLTYSVTPDGAPAVTYVDGGPPRAGATSNGGAVTVDPGGAPWPVQVAVSQSVAQALGIGAGDRLPAEDDDHQPVRIRVSGVYTAADPQDPVWQLSPELLSASRGVSEGLELVYGGALVTPDSLPDLQVAVPSDELAQHITFLTRPSVVRWSDTDTLTQEVAHLQVSTDSKVAGLTWSSALGQVLTDGRAQVSAARGQAQVVLVGLIVAALLVLALAAQLLVRRRSGPIVVARERGASLIDVAGELLVEALLVALAGATLGLVTAGVLAGGIGWAWSAPIVAVAVLAAPLQGAATAARATSVRKAPANRSARRTLERGRRVQRLALEGAVVAAAVLSYLALHQRGIVQDTGWGGLTAASAATWMVVVGTLLVARALPPVLRLGLRGARRSVHGGALLVTARLSQTAGRLLPALAVAMAVAQLTFAIALAVTEQHGQEDGARLAVGGDARLTAAPAAGLGAAADRAAEAPGVRAAVAARVADGVQLVSDRSAVAVRLVVVDAESYQHLLADSPLPDAPELSRLTSSDGDQVPALLLGGSADLRDGPTLRWQDTPLRLDVVGSAPRVEAASQPVVVVDAGAVARAGAVVAPDRVWAVGPGAADALQRVDGDGATLTTYAEELDARRDAPLASALVRLAAASSVPLLLFAVLGVVLAAAAEAPARGQSLGRLRALGLADRDLRRILTGELLATVTVAGLAGLALGVGCGVATFGSLSLQRITGQTTTPGVVVPWWVVLSFAAVLLSALVVAAVEWRRLRRRVLAQLLRS